MATFVFKLPDIGEGVMEGEIVKWLVKPGDAVEEDTPVVEVMTDKATVTIPTPHKGTITRLHGQEGDLAKVHQPLVELEVSEAALRPSAPVAPPRAANGHLPPPPTALAAAVALPPSPPAGRPVAAPRGGHLLATPVTRRMAREHHVDLAQVAGTGPQGRVLKVDVEAFLAASAAPAPESGAGAVATRREVWAPLGSASVDQRIPLRGLRKKIAEKMVRSKFTAPHYAFVEEVDASALVALRRTLNDRLAGENVKLSYLPFFVKAVLAAFRKHPQVNANMDEATQELIVRGEPHIGIAAMTDQGLTVPVLRKANGLSLRGLSDEIGRLAAAAREHRLKLEELQGGTFTITSLGQTGGLFATPIINHPEVAIMGVHRMRPTPVVNEAGQVVVRPVLHLSFCFDHRVIDGAAGAAFAYEVIRFVEQPELLMVDLV
jgi:pyruvate dehydrogenase E2 component (dihydrolipoamide acetyltransferase)